MLEEESQPCKEFYIQEKEKCTWGWKLIEKSSDIWLYVKDSVFSNTIFGFASQESEGIQCSECLVLSSSQYLQWYECVITQKSQIVL